MAEARHAPPWRPHSLAEVARRALETPRTFDPRLREFLDTFYSEPAGRAAGIADEPESVGVVQDVYLAAVAEHLARAHDLHTPDWTAGPRRFLKEPYFAGGLEALKAILIVESPAAFRRRLIFVSADALDRPQRTVGAA